MRLPVKLAAAGLLFLVTAGTSIGAPAAGHANGSASFDKHSATIKYGWLVRGPDEFAHGKSILRIYLSSTDSGAKIQACDSLSCADESIVDGGFVDFSDAPYNGYWLTLGGGHVQFSGGADAKAFALTTNQPNHLAGKIRIDDSSFGGAKLDAEFDLPLLKTFGK
jgi:hypothetical protein